MVYCELIFFPHGKLHSMHFIYCLLEKGAVNDIQYMIVWAYQYCTWCHSCHHLAPNINENLPLLRKMIINEVSIRPVLLHQWWTNFHDESFRNSVLNVTPMVHLTTEAIPTTLSPIQRFAWGYALHTREWTSNYIRLCGNDNTTMH